MLCAPSGVVGQDVYSPGPHPVVDRGCARDSNPSIWDLTGLSERQIDPGSVPTTETI